MDSIVFQSEKGAPYRERGLQLEGRIGESEPLAENMRLFYEAVKPIIAGINPQEVKYSAHITASSGFNFRAINDVEEVYKKEA